MTRPKVPSQADVSALAGVSRATVSQILNNKAGFSVPQSTRQRVLAAAQQLGYIPNVSARNLRTQKTNTIGVVIQDINNPFYPAFVRGVQDIAESVGYDVVSYNTDSTEARELHFIDVLLRGRVDGVIGVFWHAAQSLQKLTDRGIPVAVLGDDYEPATLVDVIYVDDAQASRKAVQHLIDLGHQRITAVTGPRDLLKSRVTGYVSAMTEAGLEAHIEIVSTPDLGEAGGYEVGQTIFARSERPTALYAMNDLIAFGLLSASREYSIDIPAEMSLVGFDDIPAARLVTPSLTTIQPFQQILGQRCAELLMERLNGTVTSSQGRRIQMPHGLAVRASSGLLLPAPLRHAVAPS